MCLSLILRLRACRLCPELDEAMGNKIYYDFLYQINSEPKFFAQPSYQLNFWVISYHELSLGDGTKEE